MPYCVVVTQSAVAKSLEGAVVGGCKKTNRDGERIVLNASIGALRAMCVTLCVAARSGKKSGCVSRYVLQAAVVKQLLGSSRSGG